MLLMISSDHSSCNFLIIIMGGNSEFMTQLQLQAEFIMILSVIASDIIRYHDHKLSLMPLCIVHLSRSGDQSSPPPASAATDTRGRGLNAPALGGLVRRRRQSHLLRRHQSCLTMPCWLSAPSRESTELRLRLPRITHTHKISIQESTPTLQVHAYLAIASEPPNDRATHQNSTRAKR